MLYVAPGEGCLPNRVLAALGRGITKVVVRNRLNKFWLILSARTLMTCLQGGVMFNESEVYLLSHFTSFEVSIAPAAVMCAYESAKLVELSSFQPFVWLDPLPRYVLLPF